MKDKRITIKAGDIIIDGEVYPRSDISTHHVATLVAALNAGATLPPPIICAKTKRVVDGAHRVKAHLRIDRDAKIEAVARTYSTDADLYADAMCLNRAHGLRLDTHDRVHATIVARRLGIPDEVTAKALDMTTESLIGLLSGRTAKTRGSGPIAIKRTIKHMGGATLTARQAEANAKLSGMAQSFYVNQIITLIESGLLNRDDTNLLERLEVLRGLLDGLIPVAASA